MSADNLPRPDGAWMVDPSTPTRVRDHNDEPIADTDSRHIAECIAALPERIRRMDTVRAWAESVLLASADDDGPDIDVLRNAARHVLDLLDDRPTDGQKETHATT